MTLDVPQTKGDNRGMKSVLVIFVFCAALVAQVPSSTQMGYSFTLATDQTNTTVGVKDASGTLIRTISRGISRNAGTYQGIWDGNTDAGTTATGGPFTIALLYGNPLYTFDGTIGNTSNSWTGYQRWTSGQEYLPFAHMSFIGGTGWMTQGSSEGTNGLM